jgi:aryl-alcohol dehydrogenase-like predicted oxidoreductase
MKQLARKAAEHCRNRGSDLASLGMQFCLSEERIPTTITGAARSEELERNLQTLNVTPDPVLLAEVLSILDPVQNQFWQSGNWVEK